VFLGDSISLDSVCFVNDKGRERLLILLVFADDSLVKVILKLVINKCLVWIGVFRFENYTIVKFQITAADIRCLWWTPSSDIHSCRVSGVLSRDHVDTRAVWCIKIRCVFANWWLSIFMGLLDRLFSPKTLHRFVHLVLLELAFCEGVNLVWSLVKAQEVDWLSLREVLGPNYILVMLVVFFAEVNTIVGTRNMTNIWLFGAFHRSTKHILSLFIVLIFVRRGVVHLYELVVLLKDGRIFHCD
jgi:hypothetical protein